MCVVKQFEGPICFTRIARRANKLHMQAYTAPVSSAMGVREILVYVRNTNGGSACFVGTSGPWFPSPGYNETAQMWTGHAAAMGTWWVIVTQGLLYVTRAGLVVGVRRRLLGLGSQLMVAGMFAFTRHFTWNGRMGRGT